MSLRRSFSEQQRPWKPRGESWRRAQSHSFYPAPPPRPPPPPVEISKTTKTKLKRFAFQDIMLAKDERDKGSRASESDKENGPRKKKIKTQQKSAHASVPMPAAVPDPESAEPAPAPAPEQEPEPELPSTQPDKVSPISVTPEFLSIHIRTPRARFAWQDLAGTPDKPRIKEPLGISPNAQLSWVTVAEPAEELPSVRQRQAGPSRKRRRSLSPPSSPSSSKSRKAALNVQRFKEVLKTALANPIPPAARRTRLARHHTAAGAMASAGAPRAGEEPEGGDPSPRGSLRRTMSCGTPLPKRQRVGEERDGRSDEQQPFAQRLEPPAPSSPPTNASEEPMPSPAPPKADTLSDYGDDFFDDDVLAEIDASIAPGPREEPPPSVHDLSLQVPTGEKDEFDDDLDDDVFAAAEDLLVGMGGQPAEPTAAAPKPAAVDDMEDMYGDDFGADFDYDAAEAAATQAVASQVVGKAAPWANSTNSSGPKPRAIQRYLVKQVSEEGGEKVLTVQADRTNVRRTVRLRGDWAETPASVGAYVHVIGAFDAAGTCVVDNEHNMLVLHPDQLVSATVVADSFSCTRRAVLQDRVKATSESSPALVYGTLLHEIFQDALLANRWDRAFLAAAVEQAIHKHLEKLYTIRVDKAAAREHLLTQTAGLPGWASTFLSEEPGPQSVVQGRHGERVHMSINKLLDVEEHVWSPMFGLKGNIDATVQVRMGTGAAGDEARTLTVPFELKTGRHANSSHQAQTVLYNLLMSDRYDVEVVYGVLYYMESAQMLRVPTVRHELRHMMMQRNELACHVRERSVRLPPMKQGAHACTRCYAQTSCFVYHRLADGGDGETSGLGAYFDDAVQHLTPRHREFFLHWEDLLTKEERESQRLRRELWTMVSSERERLGRCWGDLVLSEAGEAASSCADGGGGGSSGKVNRFRYSFVKEKAAPNFSFLDSQLAVGEPVVVSDEEGHFALAIGFVTGLRRQRVDVAVDRRLHNVRVRQPGFDEETNQVFAGIMEVGGGGRGGGGGGREQASASTTPLRYRLDKDEFSNGMATVRNNLVQIMAGQLTGSHEIRRLVVDLEAPRWAAKGEQQSCYRASQEAQALNIDQKRAIDKVMRAKDYALVLGMPGTGKTTTIAHIIRALVRQGKSVLLTSYTHTAVDNILLKMGGSSQGDSQSRKSILRLGAPAKVHPDVRQLAVLAEELQMHEDSGQWTFEAIQRAWHDSPVVATTCLGIGHPLFQERMFDYCIVDEASQITLPICLGPIRMARTFVLVGDHNQLPPLVQNEEARAGGLDVSLFKRLSDAHPAAVASLTHQYRMCEDIMTLSNTLIYGGRLRCGYEGLRQRSLAVCLDGLDGLCAHEQKATPCWLRHLLAPETRVAFVNTDGLADSGEEAKGNRIVNACEVRVVAQLVEALLAAGVAANDVGVMTHYRSQLALLRHRLRRATAGGDGSIEMHTADRFQGRDKEVVVLSLVRSNDAGTIGDLLRDWRRINVAFTRAKTKLLVVGSRRTVSGEAGQAARAGKTGAAGGDGKADGDGDDSMLARFVALMQERGWIYDLPADALDSHGLDELTQTQMQATQAEEATVRSPLTEKQPIQPQQQPRKPKLTLSGKENRQPLRRVRPGGGVLLKGKPILQNILDEMMGGRWKSLAFIGMASCSRDRPDVFPGFPASRSTILALSLPLDQRLRRHPPRSRVPLTDGDARATHLHSLQLSCGLSPGATCRAACFRRTAFSSVNVMIPTSAAVRCGSRAVTRSSAVARAGSRPFSHTPSIRSAGHHHESPYDPPTGWLFNVKPGEKYKNEGWEKPFFWGFCGSLVVFAAIVPFKPDTSIQTWALEEARRRLEAEGILQDPFPEKK